MEIKEKNLYTIEFANLFFSNDLPKLKEYVYDFLDLLIYLHEVLSEEKISIDENEVMSEELIIKFYLHGISICKITDTYEMTSKYFTNPKISDIRFIDISSLLAVGRSQLETLLMYNHLYINNENKEEQKLRYYAWIYTALLQRRNTPTNNEETKARKKFDEIEISRLKKEIELLSSFKKLSVKQQKSLIENGSSKLFKHWQTIFEESKLSQNKIFEKFYYILSAYSHSEGLSVIQMKTAKYSIKHPNNFSLVNLQTFCTLVMTSLMIKNIVQKYQSVSKRFKLLDEKTQYAVEFFSRLAKSNE